MKLLRWAPSAVKVENNSAVQVHKSPLFTGNRKNKSTSPTSKTTHGKTCHCKTAPPARGHLGHPWEPGLPFLGGSPFPQPPTYSSKPVSLQVQCSTTKKRVLKQQVNIAGIFLNRTFSSQKPLRHCCLSDRAAWLAGLGKAGGCLNHLSKKPVTFNVFVFSFYLNSIIFFNKHRHLTIIIKKLVISEIPEYL